jgi:hypothetical protein
MNIPPVCPLALQQRGEYRRHGREPSAPMMLDRVEHRIGIKPLQQDDRRAELYTCQHGKSPNPCTNGNGIIAIWSPSSSRRLAEITTADNVAWV